MLRTEWTHRLICRKYIASYDEKEALADGSEEREGAGIKAEAGTDNKVKTIITADDNSKHGRRDEGEPVYRECEEGWHGL